jgi:hypothetical protein
MGVPLQSTRVAAAVTTLGAWNKIWASPTPNRTGAAIFVTPNSGNNAFIRILPAGSSAPAGLTEGFADEVIFITTTRYLNEAARDNVDIWICGDGGVGGVVTYNAWEVMG